MHLHHLRSSSLEVFFSQASNGVIVESCGLVLLAGLNYSSRTFHLNGSSSSAECTLGWSCGLIGFPSIWWISLGCIEGRSLYILDPVLQTISRPLALI